MANFEKGFLPMSHSMSLSKKQCPLIPDELEKMSRIPYASAIRSIMYAMICTRPNVFVCIQHEEKIPTVSE